MNKIKKIIENWKNEIIYADEVDKYTKQLLKAVIEEIEGIGFSTIIDGEKSYNLRNIKERDEYIINLIEKNL